MRTKKKTNYLVYLDSNSEYQIKEQDPFTLPTKVYGNLDVNVQRVLTTFNSRDKSLGVLLSGIKGNSKTTTAKMICQSSELPVLLITEKYSGAKFQSFLESFKNDVIVFIDEFEKIYDTLEDQQEYLSILDGVFTAKKLFIFTSNSAHINEYLRNRPSRILYHFKYDNLEQATVDEIIKSELKNPEHEAGLRSILTTIGSVSVDVLLNFIDEINRFDQDARQLVKGLNIEVEQKSFKVTIYHEGEMNTTHCEFNPLIEKEFYLPYKNKNGHYRSIYGQFVDYVMYTRDGSFVFENPKTKLVFTPFKEPSFEL